MGITTYGLRWGWRRIVRRLRAFILQPEPKPQCPPHDFSVVLSDDVQCSRCDMTGASLIAQTEDPKEALARRIGAMKDRHMNVQSPLFEMSFAPRSGCHIDAAEPDRSELTRIYWDGDVQCWVDSSGLPWGDDSAFLGWIFR